MTDHGPRSLRRVSERMQREILADYHAGASNEELLARYGVNRQGAWKLAKRRGEPSLTQFNAARKWQRAKQAMA